MMNQYKKLGLVLFLVTSSTMAMALRVEKPDRLTRLFWDSSDKISVDSFNHVLILMNKCLELKLENELFATTLRQLSNELAQITTNLESQALFKQRIDALIKALSQRSQKELNDVVVLQAIIASVGLSAPILVS